mmetsp:Transcript_102872/g.286492  ORF Transcript_102872/g.286492 Transcript_102872/m.286492 type:complete len:210 (+) Transcript_102872:124-753(+)
MGLRHLGPRRIPVDGCTELLAEEIVHVLLECIIFVHHQLKFLHVDDTVPVHIKLLQELPRLLQRDVEPYRQFLCVQGSVLVLVQSEEEFFCLIEKGIMLFLGSLLGPLLKEVVTFVVHHHKRGEVLHFDLPHRLHAQLLHIQDLHLLDAALAERGCHAADGTQVEAAVLFARLCHHGGAVALPDHDHGATKRLETVHVGVHAPGCSWPE